MELREDRKLQIHQSFLLIAVVMIIFLAVQVVGMFFLMDNLYLYQAISEILGLAIPVLAFLLITKRAKDNIHIRRVSIKNTLTISAIIALFIPVSMLLATFNMWITEHTIGLTAGLEDSIMIDNFPDYIKSILVLALVPAVCEEIAFRTAFMSGLERLGKTSCFIFVSLFFSLAHMIPEKLFSTFALSILLCYFLYRTGSVISSFIGHFVNNLIAITITYIATILPSATSSGDVSEFYGISEYGLSFIVWGALTLVVLPLIIILIKKLRKNTEHTRLNISKQAKMDANAMSAFLPALAVYVILLSIIVLTNLFTNV